MTTDEIKSAIIRNILEVAPDLEEIGVEIP
jgi:hypothetical protein